ncbi:7410_t:CDS:2, partial [Ambispora gerdemannii]
MSEYSNFSSTHEALKTIFSKASDKEIANTVCPLIWLLWMLLQQTIFEVGAEMKTRVAFFTSQASPNSIP